MCGASPCPLNSAKPTVGPVQSRRFKVNYQPRTNSNPPTIDWEIAANFRLAVRIATTSVVTLIDSTE